MSGKRSRRPFRSRSIPRSLGVERRGSPSTQLGTAVAGLALLVASGCKEGPSAAAPPPATQPGEHAGRVELAEPPVDDAAQVPAEPALSAAEAESPVESGTSRDPAPGAFPPEDFAPPHARSAQVGDGVWEPLGESTEPVMVRTTVRPHEASRFLTVHVVALDLGRLALHYMPGADDVGDKSLPSPLVAGLIPAEHRAGLVAAFNGGFMPQHGRWGMKAAGAVIVPPKDAGCTVALVEESHSSEEQRTVRIAPWPRLAELDSRIPFYRQTPPCLLDAGELHPDLLRGREKAWGGFNPNLVTRRRSAVGLDEAGRTLFYAVGVEVGPRLLAEGLRFAGAHQAAELDINDNWTRFALFEHDAAAGGPRVATMLLEDMVRQKSGYVARPSQRDFFYVRRAR